MQQGEYDMAMDADPVKMELYLQGVRDRQNHFLALIAAAAAAAVGAAGWTVVTLVSKKQWVLLAIGIGYLVGYSVRLAGRGIDKSFGVIGAAFALLGVAAGKIGTMVVLLGQKMDLPIGQVLSMVDAHGFWNFFKLTFSVVDILFYALAVVLGYTSAIWPIPAQDLLKLKKDA
jgi:hypothetical protein